MYADLWVWFPIGPAGVRTLLLFIPALIVYVLRVAQWHVGHRNTQTPWETFSKYALRKSTVITLACYTLSAWFYSEVYIWSRSRASRLDFTDQGKHYERIKLNERPLYLRYLFIALAVVQGVRHLWRDYDRINIPAMNPKNERDAATATPMVKPRHALIRSLKPMATTAIAQALLTVGAGSVLYFIGLRYFLWENYYAVAKKVLNLGRNTRPTGVAPFVPLVLMFISQGFMLSLLWQFANRAFDTYIAQAPLKKDQPITNESKDPNGSLLNGLKSKKETSKAIALWELALITERFSDRRKTVYGELQRKKAPTYKQVTDICLAEVRLLISRLSIALDPKFRLEDEKGTQQKPPPISLVPQIAQPLKEGPITAPVQAPGDRVGKFGDFTASFAKSHSSPQNSQSAKAREIIKKGHERVAKGAKEVESASSTYFTRLVASPLGWVFRHNLRRTVSLIITGAPYSRISLLCNAITTLTNLSVYSIKEDEYGQFQSVVPDIIRVFTTAIKKVDEYLGKVEVHWSDLEYQALPPADRKVPEAEQVRDCLSDGLGRILRAFGEYLPSMGMSRLEVQDAKKSAAKGPEMAMAR